MSEASHISHETRLTNPRLRVVGDIGASSVSKALEELIIGAQPTNGREEELLTLDDKTFYKQLSYLQSLSPADLLKAPLINEADLTILKEPEVYPDVIEDTYISVNPAVMKARTLVDQIRNDQTTLMLRVLRNIVATQIFKHSYQPEEPYWTEIAEKIKVQ